MLWDSRVKKEVRLRRGDGSRQKRKRRLSHRHRCSGAATSQGGGDRQPGELQVLCATSGKEDSPGGLDCVWVAL